MRCDVHAFDVTAAARTQPPQQFCFVGRAKRVKLRRIIEHTLILLICFAIVPLPGEDSANRRSGVECLAGASEEINVIHLRLYGPEILPRLGADHRRLVAGPGVGRGGDEGRWVICEVAGEHGVGAAGSSQDQRFDGEVVEVGVER